VVGVAAGLYLAKGSTSSSSTSSSGSSSSRVVDVVAAENFWGSLASQLGGVHINVTSVVSDPNADPHEYTSNPANARAITNAQLIIVNGAGYDQWALSLIGSANSPNQKVLNVQELIGQPQNANPHFWYSPYYVNDTVHAVYNDLVAMDPTDTAYFHQQYASLNSSLWASYMKQEVTIKQQFGGTPVASTEDVFVYMANATGLKVVSPPGFMSAVSEGNDPSAQDVASMEDLMKAGNSTVHLLVYNIQTPTPLTQNIKTLATQNEIPVVGVTETIQPPNLTFQAWMQGEVAALQNALNAQVLGK
jgi:zinc/manganese transport system substrate-binding protein